MHFMKRVCQPLLSSVALALSFSRSLGLGLSRSSSIVYSSFVLHFLIFLPSLAWLAQLSFGPNPMTDNATLTDSLHAAAVLMN